MRRFLPQTEIERVTGQRTTLVLPSDRLYEVPKAAAIAPRASARRFPELGINVVENGLGDGQREQPARVFQRFVPRDLEPKPAESCAVGLYYLDSSEFAVQTLPVFRGGYMLIRRALLATAGATLIAEPKASLAQTTPRKLRVVVVAHRYHEADELIAEFGNQMAP